MIFILKEEINMKDINGIEITVGCTLMFAEREPDRWNPRDMVFHKVSKIDPAFGGRIIFEDQNQNSIAYKQNITTLRVVSDGFVEAWKSGELFTREF
ncbi:hypothetical protein [Salmonella phage PHA46]